MADLACDYLVVGAGAGGLAFTDSILFDEICMQGKKKHIDKEKLLQDTLVSPSRCLLLQ